MPTQPGASDSDLMMASVFAPEDGIRIDVHEKTFF
jgi:hypothetical protein